MRRNLCMLAASIALLVAFSNQAAWGQGLLGERYVGATYQLMTPGNDDIQEIDNSIDGFSVFLNQPLDCNWDLRFSAAHSFRLRPSTFAS